MLASRSSAGPGGGSFGETRVNQEKCSQAAYYLATDFDSSVLLSGVTDAEALRKIDVRRVTGETLLAQSQNFRVRSSW